MTDVEKIEKLARRAQKINEKLEKAKELYKKRDAVTQELQELLSAQGCDYINMDDLKVRVVDNFIEKNTKYKVAAFSRYELKFEEMKA